MEKTDKDQVDEVEIFVANEETNHNLSCKDSCKQVKKNFYRIL